MVRLSRYGRNVPAALLGRSPIQRYMFKDFHGGWRPDKEPSQLEQNEMSDVFNLEYMTGGGVRKRGGFEEFTDAVTDLDNVEFFFAPRVYTIDPVGGVQPLFGQICFLMNQSDGSIYYARFGQLALDFEDDTLGADLVDSGHSLGNAGTASSNYFRIWPISVLTWEDNIYMTSLRFAGFSGGAGAPTGVWQTQDGTATGASLPIRYDAQDDTFNRPLVHDLDGDTTGFPRARTAVSYYDRIFVANVHKTGVYRYPSRIYWSNAGTSETFETNSFIDVGPDDGTEIVAILPFGEQILIFKNNSVFTLVGTDEDTFALYPLDKRMGAEGTYCVTTAAGAAYFFDIVTCSIWQYDGARFTELGEPVSKYIRENINFNASSKCVLQIFGDYIWFSFPTEDATPTQADENDETLIYDLKTQAWTRWDFGIVPQINSRFSDFTINTGEADSVVEGDANPYFVTTTAAIDDHIMKGYMGETNPDADIVWTDNGTNFEFQFRTFWFTPDEGSSRNRLRRLEILAAEISDQIDIALYRDFLNTVWTSLNFDPLAHVGSIFEYQLQQSSVDVLGTFNWLMAEISATHANEAKINGIGCQVSSRPSPRGDVGGTGYHGAT